ncbi:maleylpyruvate isomerase family mycothiol-dependent enzyme [Isoptericola cucumis]|uniref:Maleylpyruvate isomerase n=1 Tax=Isoptericola cucumis TaxID=1776856 RepID=A0ABQ2B2Q5_9MICO|nr:maleylpyruvate isomerase family mycothiol-dependent enzyme [Isoptericola cucumis]GGI06357.1 maleylpyruvate isomerase [Isoptericola cucumis]
MAVNPALVDHALTDAQHALDALTEAVRQWGDDVVAEPSALPGWTRGHVLSHVANVGAALARQAEYAARGEKVAPYDGGQAGRDAAIEAGASRTAVEHVEALLAARERLAAAWPDPDDAAAWSAPVAYRDGVVADALLAWWREARIHAVDATAGTSTAIGSDTWGDRFCAHLRDFLAVRLPGPRDDGLELDGDPRDVAAWLAGREPAGPVGALRGGARVPLPELGPWPSATAPTR